MITFLKQPVHCYMINDRIYMTEKNVDSDVKHKHRNKRKKFYASVKEKSIKKKKLTFLNLTGFELATP